VVKDDAVGDQHELTVGIPACSLPAPGDHGEEGMDKIVGEVSHHASGEPRGRSFTWANRWRRDLSWSTAVSLQGTGRWR